MRLIDMIAICIVWMSGSCASNGAKFIQDMAFEPRIAIDRDNAWYVQTSGMADSISWTVTNALDGKVYGNYPPHKLQYISIEPFRVKGAQGYFTPVYFGRFQFTVSVWSDWGRETVRFNRDIHRTETRWESIDLDRILRPDIMP